MKSKLIYHRGKSKEISKKVSSVAWLSPACCKFNECFRQLIIMGSCIGKNVKEENQEEMLTTYKLLNTGLAVSRNNELVSMRMVVTDLINQNKILQGYLQLEVNEKERLQNLFPVIV